MNNITTLIAKFSLIINNLLNNLIHLYELHFLDLLMINMQI